MEQDEGAPGEGTTSLAAVVLAAGLGTRMRSARAKVLHEVLGRPMVQYPLAAALEAGADRVAVVVGHQADAVAAAARGVPGDHELVFVHQEVQGGTGHAVACAEAATEGLDEVLILCGDTPALDGATLRALRAAHREAGAALTLTSFRLEDPTGYGRVVRGGDGAALRIVEHRDATADQRRLDEVNAGIYVVERALLYDALARCSTDNAQGELYLTDVVELAAGEGRRVEVFALEDARRAAGVNTREQLGELERFLLAERCRALMLAGVTLEDPSSVRIEAGVTVGPDSRIGAGVQLLGATRLGESVRVEVGCVLRDTAVDDGAHLKPYVVTEQAHLGPGVVAGPFAHLRPGAVLRDGARVGNFVEMKKTVLGPGSKANHLTYLGDCEVGAGVNVGAGTITCNYDGTDKHRTVIEDGVFIGSDTQLVAPVTIGRRATVAAGTTVVHDVPAGALVLSRAEQVVREGYDERHRRPREEAKRRRRSGPV